MRFPERLCAALVAGVVVVLALSGCGLSEEERTAVQEGQLREFVEKAEAWGADIVAQVPETEVELLSENVGGSRGARDYGEEWPKYYYWAQIVVLHPEGPRSPTQVADDLIPWLEAEGWERNKDSEFPPSEETFERDYYRDGYHLIVEVYTIPPPHAQKLTFTIVTPATDPGHS